MKYSQLHTKTDKAEEAKQYDSINATYLIQGGFIHQTMAGVYSFLPLGLRVLEKIEDIVREELDTIGVEVKLPAISPKSLWKTTDRLEKVDVLMKTMGANKLSQDVSTNEYILNSTHEEVITPIAKRFNLSYKDFPVAYYQIQSKFRNEARAKSGLLRGREFRMKDLYSFHRSLEDFKEFYEQAKEVYMRVFERLGLGEDTLISLASGGDFTDEYSHEFQTRCDTGEDVIFRVPSTGVAYNQEVAPSQAANVEPDGDERDLEKVETKDITGLKTLSEFLEVPVERCVKTLLYETSDGRVIAAAVRGDYDVNEEKLQDVVNSPVELAKNQTVTKVTGAEVGYAGIMDLPAEVELIADNSLKNLVNFETGANETNYHYINVNWQRDLERPDNFYDIKTAKEGDLFPETGEEYEVFTASEVGNIFPLNTKFSDAFEYTYTDQDGTQQPVFMGSYGIGTTRLMGVIVEKFNDDKGIIWPEQLAPFKAYLISFHDDDDQADELYQKLTDAGVEVLWDDRNESAGVKFADADLLGIPYRLVISNKTGDKVELKKRQEEATQLVTIQELLDVIT